jgi:hypothetical protein
MLQLQRVGATVDDAGGDSVKAWPLAVLAWGVVVACAAQHAATTAPPPVMPQMERGSSPKAQIEELSNQIDADRTKMGLAEPQVVTPTAHVMTIGQMPTSHDAACHPAASQTCTDSCKLSDSICDNAGKICNLADQLQGDGWAADKCSRAKATCEAAHAKCCDCQL